MNGSITDHDTREQRCPRLGHPVTFGYCRQPASAQPCNKIFDCWWEYFEVVAFMSTHYDAPTLAALSAPPQPKTLTLLDLVHQAQQRLNHNR